MVMRFLKSLLTVVILTAALPAGSGAALAGEHQEGFYGSFVGSGTANRVAENKTEQRDLDVTVEAYKKAVSPSSGSPSYAGPTARGSATA